MRESMESIAISPSFSSPSSPSLFRGSLAIPTCDTGPTRASWWFEVEASAQASDTSKNRRHRHRIAPWPMNLLLGRRIIAQCAIGRVQMQRRCG
mmetsp:Transcript_22322/g.51211  ORF Transcript_22322/g.51211 Transcript_22322/m.51211 type:complete len:94 (-) Transcript_22322:15-296(-)